MEARKPTSRKENICAVVQEIQLKYSAAHRSTLTARARVCRIDIVPPDFLNFPDQDSNTYSFESFQRYPIPGVELCRQSQFLRQQIELLNEMAERRSTYTSDSRFAKAFLLAVTLKIKLKRFNSLHGRTTSKERDSSSGHPQGLFDGLRRVTRGNFAVSTSRHLSKFPDSASQRMALKKLNRDISDMGVPPSRFNFVCSSCNQWHMPWQKLSCNKDLSSHILSPDSPRLLNCQAPKVNFRYEFHLIFRGLLNFLVKITKDVRYTVHSSLLYAFGYILTVNNFFGGKLLSHGRVLD